MPTCQYISKLKAGAIHFAIHLDCSHEFRATYGVEVKRNGTDLTENCLVQFYVMKSIGEPSPTSPGWDSCEITCANQPD